MKLPDPLANMFAQVKSEKIGSVIEELTKQAIQQRRGHERRWYDNNFFDDGYHFRTVSRKTGQIIDHLGKGSGHTERAIPRASRQIRGISNLLFAAEPYPVVYPERITVENFRDPITNEVDLDAYKAEYDRSKKMARKRGIWLTTEWEDCDLSILLIDMILLAAKNSVSYLQVYSEDGKICTWVGDAFDVIVYGDRRELQRVPFITKAESMEIQEIMADPRFDEKMVAKLQPDNKYATSEIKDAYMRSRFGEKSRDNKERASIIVKETFMKEVLTDENWKFVIKKTENDSNVMEGKSRGDLVMRHPFSAGGVTLDDGYVDYDLYPFADFRFEPGPLYQTPLIERFIPQNKSVDIVVTRLEKWVNSMIVGVYQKRKGENYQISNFPGGQVMEYETTPLTQMNHANVGNTPFNVLNMLDKYIDEQGTNTASGGQLPSGVKSGVAIESLKATEYANLKIATLMLKKTIKTIAKLMMERAHKDYMEPKEIEHLDDGEPDYFDVIGKRGFDMSEKVGKTIPENTITIDKDTKIRIEIEPGLGFTEDGKRNSMQQIIDYLLKFAEAGYIPQEAIKIAIKNFMETYGFGSTQEFMESVEEGLNSGDLTDKQIQQIKIAVLETLKDAGAVGPDFDNKLVDSTKLGTLEAMKDSGMLNKQEAHPAAKGPSESISFKDLPPEGQTQMAAKAGINISPEQIQENEVKKQATSAATQVSTQNAINTNKAKLSPKKPPINTVA